MKILLRAVMKQRHISVRQVAIKTGISKSTIERIAIGEVSPTMHQMERLAAGLHMRISALYRSRYQ